MRPHATTDPEERALRVGLLGGSFVPVHSGHVACAQVARRSLRLDRVLFLPTAQPPHKPEREFAPPLHRYVMVELALLGEEGLYASPVEWTPGRTAYTVETVERLSGEHPGWTFVLLIGADSFGDLPTWRRWRDLVAQVEIAVAVRPGWDLSGLRQAAPDELRAAVDAGTRAAERVSEIVSTHVIPRPHEHVDDVLPLGRKSAEK